jgi:hypothetical protein
MEASLSIQPRWTSWQKKAYRFFFIFLTLQVLTENFLGNLFGNTLFMWRLGEKVFVSPCLWLNGRLFHFKYIPQSWTTFSGALHTIRDILYLVLACAGAVIWTMLDGKAQHYERQLYWFSKFLLTALSCIVYAYGIMKVFSAQMAKPSPATLRTAVGRLSPFELIWAVYGYGTPYQVFGGLMEVMGAVLILFSRTRVAGLLIIASVMINVILLNYTFQIGVLVTSFYILLVTLFLLAPYLPSLVKLFFFREKADLSPDSSFRGRGVGVLKIVCISFVAMSFLLNTWFAYTIYKRRNHRPVPECKLMQTPRIIIIFDDTSDSE